MPTIERIRINNYRALRDINFAAHSVNVIFGANGVGKTTFLDALSFVRECVADGPEGAAAERHHGIGLLTEGAPADQNRILIGFDTEAASYDISFGYANGRIEPYVGESLVSRNRGGLSLINRLSGSEKAQLYHEDLKTHVTLDLPDPERLALSNFMLLCPPEVEAEQVNNALRSIHFYSSRSVNLYQLRRLGSDGSVHTYPFNRWQNLWSALRNLQGRGPMDNRYKTIIGYMRDAFPQSFKDLLIEPLGPERVGGSIVEPKRANPILASGVSDGHLQMLGLLTSLFGDTINRPSVIMFDEPETSLHPHAIAVFAKAVKEAAANWDRQVFIATHSPVLLSQFSAAEVVVASLVDDGSTRLERLSEQAQLSDLLEDFSIGSLYMSQVVGAQGAPIVNPVGSLTP